MTEPRPVVVQRKGFLSQVSEWEEFEECSEGLGEIARQRPTGHNECGIVCSESGTSAVEKDFKEAANA